MARLKRRGCPSCGSLKVKEISEPEAHERFQIMLVRKRCSNCGFTYTLGYSSRKKGESARERGLAGSTTPSERTRDGS